ncbi:hypothetical protein Tco_1493473, partial [Tanacetum coccineum]
MLQYERDISGDHVVSCAGIIGIKHRHNVVRDILVDICFRSRISTGKEIDIELGGGHDIPLRLADMLLYSWDGWLDEVLHRVCRWWEIDFQLWRSFSEWDEWFSSIRLPGSVK